MNTIFKSLLIAIAIFSINICNAQQLSIIPYPNSIIAGEGNFIIQSNTKFIAETKEAKVAASFLVDKLNNATGEKLSVVDNGKSKKTICFKLVDGDASEAYNVVITTKSVEVTATSQSGLFYGAVSLLQMLPAEVIAENKLELPLLLPVCTINDIPAFQWRAFMFDESRYFHGEVQVKKILDQMAMLKMNTFHWHLTDDQGWRIEIKKYPKLTTVGSKRSDSQIGGWNSEKYSGVPHEGFYTQEQIKDIIEYAQKLSINIIPEIEMPGHSCAAIAAYPWLGSRGIPMEVPTKFGKLDDVYNVADERVYKFFTDVLDEVFELFPSTVIHIGGDEVKFGAWETNKQIQELMKEKDLKTYSDVQIHFTNKISQYFSSKDRIMMGWNDILGKQIHQWQSEATLDGNQTLDKKSVVHFWKGDINLFKQAINDGYSVVNSTHQFTYLDYGYNNIPLKKAYTFNPVPKGLSKAEANQVVGLGCQLWTEWIPTTAKLDYMAFPRIAAYACAGWENNELKDYNRFLESMKDMCTRWDILNIDYAKKEIK